LAQNIGMENATDDLARAVGQVCISASTLEWTLAYLTSVLRRWSDAKFVEVVSRPGQPLHDFRALVSSLATIQAPELQAGAGRILADAEGLLKQRHRVVHSVMIDELEPGSRLYDAWHAKTNALWSVDLGDLHDLARDLEGCARAADAFGAAWEQYAERAGWPDLDPR
jgi:hypothetical protein